MMTKSISDLAREANLPYYYRTGEISNLENLQCFHDLAIAQYRESLLAGVGDAVAYRTEDSTNGVNVWLFKKTAVKYQDPPDALYTADQMAAAVAIERERCAKVESELAAYQAVVLPVNVYEALKRITELEAALSAKQGEQERISELEAKNAQLLAKAEHYQEQWSDVCNENQQLLEALRLMVENFCWGDMNDGEHSAITKARAAVAAVESLK